MASLSFTTPVDLGDAMVVTVTDWSGNPAEYVGIYSTGPAEFPPPFGFQMVTATVNPTVGTATITAPVQAGAYQMKLRDSTDQTVPSLAIVDFLVIELTLLATTSLTVTATGPPAPPSGLHFVG